MPRPRTSISELELTGSTHLNRSQSYRAKAVLQHRADIEEVYERVKARCAEALADVEQNGQTIWQDRYNGNRLYRIKVINPALKIMQQCERQLAQLAKMLSADDANAAAPGRMSDEELLKLVRGTN